LPAVGVEAALDDVAVDGDFGVLVTLPQDAAFALLEVGWAPGAVQVVQRDRAGLDVGPYAHFDGAADQYLDVTGSGCGEQLSLSSSLRASWMNRIPAGGMPAATSLPRSSS